MTANEAKLARQLATLIQGITDSGLAKQLMNPEFHIDCIDAIEKAGMHEGKVEYLRKTQKASNPI